MSDKSEPAWDMKDRTLAFAKAVRRFVKTIPRTVSNRQDVIQVVRSSGSIGANYLEANDALGDKDFSFRMRIARKEAKETHYWLQLIDAGSNESVIATQQELIDEAEQLTRILSAMLKNHASK